MADTPGSVGAAPKHNAGDHSSRAYVAVSLKRSTRRWGASSSSLLLDLAPGGVYLASQVTLAAGALLPHRSTLTGLKPAVHISVALSLRSPSPDVNRHSALWSSDFPRLPNRIAAIIFHTHTQTNLSQLRAYVKSISIKTFATFY